MIDFSAVNRALQITADLKACGVRVGQDDNAGRLGIMPDQPELCVVPVDLKAARHNDDRIDD